MDLHKINDLIRDNNLEELQKFPELFCDMNMDMLYGTSLMLIFGYERLNIVKWILSINKYSEQCYRKLLFGACRLGNKEILLYLVSLNMFQTPEINTFAFECALKYEQFIGKNGLFMDFVYSTLRYIDITANKDKIFILFINEMKMYSTTYYDPACLPNWFITKKPYRYGQIVLQPNTISYTTYPKPQQNWSQLLPVLFMSQVKPEYPHKSSIFRSISDDVVKIIGQYLTEYYQ